MNPDINELTPKEAAEMDNDLGLIVLMGGAVIAMLTIMLALRFPVQIGCIAIVTGVISFKTGKKKLALMMIIVTTLLFFFAAVTINKPVATKKTKVATTATQGKKSKDDGVDFSITPNIGTGIELDKDLQLNPY